MTKCNSTNNPYFKHRKQQCNIEQSTAELFAVNRIKNLEEQRDELLSALLKFGRHHPLCPEVILNSECDCGFNAAIVRACQT